MSSSAIEYSSARPKDVGILAMEMYFPKRVSFLHGGWDAVEAYTWFGFL